MSPARSIPYYTADDVRAAVSMQEMIGAMQTAFAAVSSGAVEVPPRTRIDVTEHEGVALFMPVYLRSANALGIKTVTLFRKNPAEGKPTIHGLMMLMNGKTGEPVALVEADSLTALRTGASSGVATDLLSRPESHSVAVIGTGPQGEAQLAAVCAVRPITHGYVCGRDKRKAERFAARMSGTLNITLDAADAEDAVKQADIVCTATSSTEPLFDHRSVRPGTHLNAIGSYKPDRREIPGETIAAALLFVDSLEAALTEAGDLVLAMEEGRIGRGSIRGEIGELLDGSVKGRNSPEQITLYKSVGNGAQDLLAALEIHRRLEASGTGQTIIL